MELNQLNEIYDRYVQKTAKVLEEAGALDGFMGWGDDPRKNHCHMEFYEGVQEFIAAFLQESHTEEQVYAVADQLLRTPVRYRDQAVYWYMYAAHGLCKPLIPLLSPAHCAALRELYDGEYPRRDRMPVQAEVYKLLKKRARA